MLKNKPSDAGETVTFFSGEVIPQKERKKKTIDSAFLSVVQQLLKKRHVKHRPNVSALRLLVL